MDSYFAAMDKIGDAIIGTIDPDSTFTGYTKVRNVFFLYFAFDNVVNMGNRIYELWGIMWCLYTYVCFHIGEHGFKASLTIKNDSRRLRTNKIIHVMMIISAFCLSR